MATHLLNEGDQPGMVEGVEAYFADHKQSEDLGRLALRGGIVSVAMQYGNGALQLAAAIILARLLGPEDYGLVAIVTVLTSFAPVLVDFGLGDATAQRIRITPSQISALWWFSTAIGVSVAAVVAACSPLIATLFREPRLEPIALCTAISFVLWGVSNLHLALLRRTMQFGTIARIQGSGTVVGIVVAISMASSGYGYWALVLRPISSAFCVACGAWFFCRWRPAGPSFDDEVRSMLRFGLHVVGFVVAYTLARTVDRIGLSLFYRPEVVGYYQNATTLYEYSITSALGQVHTVGSASLSKLQSDPVILRRKYEAALSALAFFVMPLAAILSVTAKDVTVLLLGEKWQVTGSLLSIIALRGVFQVIVASQGWLHLSLGRPDRWQKWGVISLVIQAAAVSAGLPFGPMGVAAALVIATLLIAIPSIKYAGRPIELGTVHVLRATGSQLIGAIAILGAGWSLQITVLSGYPGFARILLAGTFCTCLYLLIVIGLFRLTEPIRIVGSVVRDLLGSR
jgi:O-antigen/teichoic acid export membrane protein